MKTFTTIIFLTYVTYVNAQNIPYADIERELTGYSCVAPPSEDECRQGIKLIEAWLEANPSEAEPSAFDALGTYYYVLSAKDSSNRIAYLQQSVRYGLRYADVAAPKKRHLGYWNAAVGCFFLNDCEKATRYLRLAKSSPRAVRFQWDKGTVRGIKKVCGNR